MPAVHTPTTRRPGRAALLLAATCCTALAGCGHAHRAATPTTPPTTPATTSTTARPRPPARHPVVAPLTGLPASSKVAKRVAVIVKVDNVSAALPQVGVSSADVVYEEMVEGGLSRLAAVYQSHRPTVVGPVRSGRLTDEGIADDLNHPVLAYAGTNGLFQPILASQPLTDLEIDNAPSAFFTDPSRIAPHATFTNVATLAGMSTTHAPPPALWAFRAAGTPFTAAGAITAATVTVTFPAASAAWSWDPRTHTWLRTQDGVPDVGSDGHRLAAANVIIQAIPYSTSGYVSGEGAGANGDPIPFGHLDTSGTAWYLSGGRIARGTWSRASLRATTRYLDAAGHPIRLAPGVTWVELPQQGTTPGITR